MNIKTDTPPTPQPDNAEVRAPDILEALARSGQSVAMFAREHGIKPHRIYQLRHLARARSQSSPAPADRQPLFMRVRPERGTPAELNGTLDSDRFFVIRGPGQVSLSVPLSASAAQLRVACEVITCLH